MKPEKTKYDLTDEDKINLVLDIKQGRINPKILSILNHDGINVHYGKEDFRRKYDLTEKESEEIISYLKKIGRWISIGFKNKPKNHT